MVKALWCCVLLNLDHFSWFLGSCNIFKTRKFWREMVAITTLWSVMLGLYDRTVIHNKPANSPLNSLKSLHPSIRLSIPPSIHLYHGHSGAGAHLQQSLGERQDARWTFQLKITRVRFLVGLAKAYTWILLRCFWTRLKSSFLLDNPRMNDGWIEILCETKFPQSDCSYCFEGCQLLGSVGYTFSNRAMLLWIVFFLHEQKPHYTCWILQIVRFALSDLRWLWWFWMCDKKAKNKRFLKRTFFSAL